MLLIAHRGNCSGLNPERENTHDYIDEAIERGYDVEIDIWSWNDVLWLGHDEPQYPVDQEWLLNRKDKLWIHCKDFKSLDLFMDSALRFFYHEKENYTAIMGSSNIWAHNLQEVNSRCIIPLLSLNDITKYTSDKYGKCYGICSDYVTELEKNI